MNRLRTLGIVVGGAVAGFAIYTFGWHDDDGGSPTIPTVTQRHHVYTLNEGDVVRVPASAARCEVSQEAGISNFYCVHIGRTRYQVFLWSDRADLYDLARQGEPMVPTYSVPGVRRQKQRLAATTMAWTSVRECHMRAEGAPAFARARGTCEDSQRSGYFGEVAAVACRNRRKASARLAFLRHRTSPSKEGLRS